jgi:catechol 2,3-dioxygenase-like lactoylglutathione lyase family enzyme
MSATNTRTKKATKARKRKATKTRKHERQERYASRTGAVLFANRVDRVAAFYSNVLGLREANRDDDHILLESPGFQLVVHRVPGHAASSIEAPQPPIRRASASFKPVFFVHSLAKVRATAKRHGGAVEPRDQEWSFDGVVVCDALDPEGNVIQFRETRS